MKRTDSLVTVSLLALIGFLVRCLMTQQATTASQVKAMTDSTEERAQASLKTISTSFTTSIETLVTRMSDLAKDLMLGRDLPLPSENSPMNSSDSETLSEPEIAMSDLPETAAWAWEEESALTQMPWQSSTQQPDSELTL